MRAPIGHRIRKRRQELSLSQTRLAAKVGISSSYLNLIEHNKRAIGGRLLLRIAEAIDLDSRALAGTEEARLIAELVEIADDPVLGGVAVGPQDAADIVAHSPVAARAMLALYRAYREARLRSDMIGERLGEERFLAEASNQILALITTIRSYSEILVDYGDLTEAERGRFIGTLVSESERLAASAVDMFDFMAGRGHRRPRPSPREEIEDFISDRANHFPSLEAAAEATAARSTAALPTLEGLAARLQHEHGVTVTRAPRGAVPPGGERHRAEAKALTLADGLSSRSVRFRLARLIGRLEHAPTIDALVDEAGMTTDAAAEALASYLASYFAAALLMPYGAFHAAAEELRHDLARLGVRFDASFEQVCHRLATLRRPAAEGVPLHFLRTDIAGNISKRFSASGLRLPRYGGACPRWIVHHAFTTPGRIVHQVAQLPDGETFFFVARAETPGDHVAGLHAVMIGAPIAHAGRFVYADGLDLAAPSTAAPVGITCRQCPRADCADRAFERIALPAGV
jgi:XRE family transcriptional regulator, fatty acid utilization regulator